MKVLQSILEKIRDFIVGIWEKTDKRDRFRYLLIALIAVVLIIGSLVMLNQDKYQSVATNLTSESLGKITPVLDTAGIKYKTEDAGKTILVDKKDFAAANAALVQSTDVATESIDYSIYQMASGITATDADKQFYEKSQKEEQLRNILLQFDAIENARVVLNLPDTSKTLFQSEADKAQSTASIELRFKEGSDKGRTVVSGIADLISNSTGISPENIAILDETMHNLNKDWTNDTSTVLTDRLQFEQDYERDVADTIKHLLDPVVGSDHNSVVVNAVLDFDNKSSEEIKFTPVVDDEGIARSMQTVKEEAHGGADTSGEPGVDENGAGDTYTANGNEYSDWSSVSNTINYEINQLTTKITQAEGKLEDISVAVNIDQSLFVGDDGSAIESATNNVATIQNMIGGAVGLPQDQYSKISVNFLPFDGNKIANEKTDAYNKEVQKQQILDFLKIILLYVIIGICAVIIVWRTLSLFKPKEVELAPADGPGSIGDGLSEYGDLVDATVQSMELDVVKSPSRERIEEFIEVNPQAVANMLRTWLSDEGEGSW